MHRMPVLHDDQSFRDRTERMFREMHEKMGFHSLTDPSWSISPASWSTAHDPGFFELWPSTGQSQPQGTSSSQSEILDDDTTRSLFCDLNQGQGHGGEGRLFRMNFDMRQYDPADISVRTENDCLVVEAKHFEDKAGGSNGSASNAGSKVVRQFCRRIQLPKNVDPAKLTSTLSTDNILTVQAPVPPAYSSVVGSAGLSAPQSQPQLRASPIPSSFNQPSGVQYLQQQLQAPGVGITASGRISPRLGTVVVQPTPAPTLDLPVFSVDPATGRRRLDLAIELGPPYTAEDVAVRLEGRRLTIEARHENRDSSRGRVSTTSTQKQFDLGEDVDPTTIRASLNDSGRLSIVALVK